MSLNFPEIERLDFGAGTACDQCLKKFTNIVGEQYLILKGGVVGEHAKAIAFFCSYRCLEVFIDEAKRRS